MFIMNGNLQAEITINHILSSKHFCKVYILILILYEKIKTLLYKAK